MNSTTHSQPHAAGQAAHTPTPYVARKQYRSNDLLPHYWDICTVREAGADTVYETVAETLSEQDASFITTACNAYASDQRKIAALVVALESLLEQADLGAVDEETAPIVEQARAALQPAKQTT